MESHAPDTLDRQLLLALDIDGRAPFSRVAAVLGVSDQTVARRFRRLRADVGVRVVGVRDVERLGQERWMLRLRCTPDAAFAIARALARRPDTAWIGLASGGTEVVGMIRMRTRGEHDELLLGKLPRTPSIVEIRAHQLLHGFYGGPGRLAGQTGRAHSRTGRRAAAGVRGAVGPAASRASPRTTNRSSPPSKRDGRASFAELQKATGRSESAVRRRLDQLLRSGALFIDVQFDSDAFGYGTRALLWITAAPSALEAVGRALATHPEVAFAAATAGHCNLVAVIVCRDTASVYRYLNESLGRLAGVQHVECAPVLRTVKQLRYEERR